MDHPYIYRLTVRKTISSKHFDLGKGSIIVLNSVSQELLTLLREVYRKDKFALEMSGAAATYLLNSNKERIQSIHPCICPPEKIDFKFRIVS